MNYHSDRELQDYFDSASAICFEAFPKQTYGDYFTKEQKGTCQSYIPHGIHLRSNLLIFIEQMLEVRKRVCWETALSRSLADFSAHSSTQLSVFCLIAHGISSKASDYELCLRIVDIAWSACDDKDGLQYSILYDIRAQPTMSSTSWVNAGRIGRSPLKFN